MNNFLWTGAGLMLSGSSTRRGIDKHRGVVMITDMNHRPVCPICHCNGTYVDKYDRYGCETCNVWLESSCLCDEKECSFAQLKHPEKPFVIQKATKQIIDYDREQLVEPSWIGGNDVYRGNGD